MRSTERILRLLLGVAAGLVLALAGALPAGAATKTASSTWTLLDIGQRICVSPQYGHPGTYFLVPMSGSWTTTLSTGIKNLPPGSTSVGGNPILPGSNHDGTILALVQVTVAPAPVGVYTPDLWVSDGTETQTVPVTIEFRQGC
ncbi:hypothetical protein Sru01_25610 [Sphaerisporangium rufum]|uniref:Uncharacterized protein n=1 Tax=Sphaerisporangium rufum TaxID=1381558 RepID=A0A919UZB1_9ACTN|nr:DUF5980 family protein [Sphaerisporangium rufum]GII77579.1 hypothetical protein Sru01_25610 [Sphaerisporangium rufum]